MISVSATTVLFTATYLEQDAPPHTITITTVDGSPLEGLAAQVTYGAGQATGWLHAALDADVVPAVLWLVPHNAVVPGPGTYTATVELSSTTPDVTPVAVRVTLEVRPVASATLRITLATVGLGGPGSGRLTGPGIDCVLSNGVQGGDCEETYVPGTVVQVRAEPATGQFFYYGGCPWPAACRDDGFDITMTGTLQQLEAGFGAPRSRLDVTILWETPVNGGLAGVTGNNGIRCGYPVGNCFGYIDGGVGEFRLGPDYDYGAGFVRWEGACTGTANQCIVAVSTPGTEHHVTAVFRTRPSTVGLSLMGEGASGSVTVSAPAVRPDGGPLNCVLVDGVPGGCSGVVPDGVGTLTITAVPAPGNSFEGWDVGAYVPGVLVFPTCTGTAPACTITLERGSASLTGIVRFARTD